MARGWESKSVDAQIESAQSQERTYHQETPDPARLELLRKKESLRMSRTRVLHQLESSQNPRYRTMLSKALADLDEQLAELG